MKKILTAFLCILTLLIFCGVLTACDTADNSGITYSIDTEYFDPIVPLGGTPDVSTLSIRKEKGDTIEYIDIDMDMILSTGDTSVAGESSIVISYRGRRYTVPYLVKYQVDFVSFGEIVETQLVLSADEIDAPTVKKDNFIFKGWDIEIPEVLSENLTVNALFDEVLPTLSSLKASFGDTLSTLTLPSNANGQWLFADGTDTTVGEVGRNGFAVEFHSLNANTVTATDTVYIDVSKAKLTFSDVALSFVYDGATHFPTYTLPVDVDVITLGDGAQSEVGTYSFGFLINDARYEGSYQGSFTVTKPDVTVRVGSYEMVWGEQMPVFEYTVEGFDNTDNILGISIVNPNPTSAGVYDIDAVVSNKNVNVTVHKGQLTVNAGELDVGTPTVESTEATYGDKLFDITFGYHPNGVWAWDETKYDADTTVGNAGKQTFVAVFTPDNSLYDKVYANVELTVAKKTLTITVGSDLEFVYDGTVKLPGYTVTDGDGNVYDALCVKASAEPVDAGAHDLKFSLDEENYCGETPTVTVTIKKAQFAADFSHVLEITYAPLLKLSEVTLPEGYTWVAPDTVLGSAGEHKLMAIYTPSSTNYEPSEGELTVKVLKAQASVTANDTYTFTYNGNAFTLDGVSASHNESAPTYAYMLGGQSISEIRNAGTYTVTITLPESTNYNAAEKTVSVTVNKAQNTDAVNTSQSATYGDTLSTLDLPESDKGEWAFVLGADATVGNAGTNTFTARFTATNPNYADREVEITVAVAKKEITAPTLATKLYNGAVQTADIPESALYTVTKNEGGTAVGSYEVILTLTDADNYCFSGSDTEQITLTFYIASTSNEWLVFPSIEGWTFGDTASTPVAQVRYGEYKVEYRLDADGAAYSSDVPTAAGNYIARFTSTDTSASTLCEEISFTVAKRSVDVPTLAEDSFAFTGGTITSGLSSTQLYTVTDNGGVTVGTYTATVALCDSANYVWSDGTSGQKKLTYTVTKADNAFTAELGIDNWTYGEDAKAPNATAQFGTVTYMYASTADGEYTETVPSGAGTYYVKAFVEDNPNYGALESEAVAFTVSPKEISVVWGDTTLTYSGEAQAPTASAEGVNGEALTLVVSGAKTDAGTYTATASLDNANYTLTNTSVEYTVSPKEVTVVWSNTALTYSGEAQAPTASAEGVNGEALTLAVSGAQTNVGTYTATASLDNANYTLTNNSTSFTIGAKTVEVVWGDTTLTYSGEAQAPTASAIGADGEILTLAVSGAKKNVGTYTATASLDNANYTLTNTSVEYTVSPKEVTVVWNNTALTYSGEAQAPTASAQGVGGEALTLVVSGAQTVVGTYTATASLDNANYTLTGASISFTIGKANAEILGAKDSYTTTYTGSTYAIPDVSASHGESTLAYTYVKNGLAVDSIVSVGTYSVTVTLAESTNYRAASVSFTVTVEKADNTDSVETEQNATYGDKLSTLTLPESTLGYWAFVDAEGNELADSTTVGNVGTNTFIAYFTATDTNYNDRTVEITVTVAPKTVSVVWGDTDFTYSGEAQSPTASAQGVNGEALTLAVSGAKTDAGTYTATASLDNANYTLTNTSVEYTIGAKSVEVVWSNTALTYSGAAQAPTASAQGVGGEALTLAVSGAKTDAGTYTATASLDNANYTLTNTSKEYTIGAKSVEVVWGNASFTYSGEAQSPTASALGVLGEALELTVSGAQTNAGTHTATASLDNANYTLTNTSKEYTIGAKSVEVVWSNTALTYSGTAQAPVASAQGVNGEVLTLSVSGAQTNAGTYTATASLDNANYTLTGASAEYTIGAKSVEVVWSNTTLTYSGEAQSPTASALGVLGEALTLSVSGAKTDAGTYTATASLDNANYTLTGASVSFEIAKADNTDTVNTAQSATYGDTLAKLTLPTSEYGVWAFVDGTGTPVGDVGENTFVATFTATDTNYNDRTVEITVTVEKRILTAPTLAAKVYNEALQVADVPTSAYYTVVENNGGTAVGEYNVTLALVSPDNCAWSDSDGEQITVTFRIVAAENEWVTAPSIDGWTYGDDASTPSAEALHGGYKVEYKLDAEGAEYSETVPTAAGSYVARFTTTDASASTKIAEVSFVIAKRVLTVSDIQSEFTYDGTAHLPVYTVNNLVDGDDAGLGFNIAAQTNVGSYECVLSASNPNYDFEAMNVTMTVTARSISVVWGNTDFTYSGTAQAPTASAEGVGGEALTLSVSGAKTNVGTYTATASLDNANYTLTNTSVEYTIGAKSVEVVWGNTALTYSGTAQAPTASAQGVNGEALTLTVSGAKTNVGTYTAVASLDNANYTLTNTSVEYTIGAKSVEVVWSNTALTYSGTAQAPTASAVGAGGELLTLAVSGAKTDAGTYTATASLDNANYTLTNTSVEYTIGAKSVEVVWGNTALTYSGIAQAPTASAQGVNSEALTLAVSGAKTNVGTYTATASLDNANYTLTNTSVEYTIGAKSVEVVWSNTALTYSGTAQSPTASALGVLGEALTLSVSGAQTNAGTYTATASIADGNYTLSGASTSFTIARLALEIPTLAEDSFAFTGGTITSGLSSTQLYTVTDNGGVTVGTYTATVALCDSANYVWSDGTSGQKKLSYTVTKADNAFTAELGIDNWTYGEDAKAPNATAQFGTVTYMYASTADGEYTEDVPTVAGTYYVKAFVEDNPNYGALESEAVAFTVSPKEISVVWGDTTLTYSGTAQAPTASAEGVNGEALTLAVSGAKTDAGTYTATASLDNANYTLTNTSVEYTIGAKSVEIVWSNTALTYSGTAQAPTASAQGVNGEALTLVVSGANTNVGAYTATASLDNANYTLTNDSTSFTIGAKSVEVVWGNASFTYSGAAQVPTASAEGVDGEALTLVVSGAKTNVGTHTATASLDDDNYTLTNDSTSFTIGAKSVEVVWGSASFIYNGAAQAPTASAEGVDGEALTLVVSGAQTNAGTYTATASLDNANYTLTGASISFTIGKANAEILGAKDSYTTTYTGSAYAIPDVSASHGESTLAYTYVKNGLAVDSIVSVGTYSVTVTLAESTNYRAASVSFTVTVEKADNTDSVETEQNATYGDKLSTLTLPESTLGYWAFVDAEGNELADSTTVGNVGTNTFIAYFTATDTNYNDRTVEITVTVAKKTVSASSIASKVYNGSTQTATVSDTALYTVVTNEGGVNAGSYDVVLRLVDAQNYCWSDTDGDSLTLSFVITQILNEWTSAPTITESWNYGAAGDSGSAESKYDSVIIEYKLSGADDSTYTTTLPTNAGSYVARFTTSDENATKLEVTLSFVIRKLSVSIPSMAQSEFNYTGETFTSGLVSTDRYTVTDGGGTDSGTYTVTLTLVDSTNYQWNDGKDGAQRTLTYKILPISVTVAVDSSYTGFTYGSFVSPTVTVQTDADYTITLYYATERGGTYYALDAAVAATLDVGTYDLKAVVSGNVNLSGEGYAAFTVTPATLTFADFTLSGGPYYENSLPGLSGNNLVTFAGVEVAGTYTTGAVTFVQDGMSTVTVTFVPDSDNFVKSGLTATMSISLKTVATVGYGGTGYGTIENALAAAKAAGGGTVFVIPDTTGNVIIKQNVTIDSTVTLVLPWGEGESDYNIATDGDFVATLNGPDADENKNPSYGALALQERTLLVKVADGLTITVNGTLTVAGELSGGNGGSSYAGHTAGRYAELMLGQGVRMTVNGTLHAFGFLTESEQDNGSKVTATSGAYVYQPFVLRDFLGGSRLYYIYQNGAGISTVYKRFIFMNIHAEIEYQYGSSLMVSANLYAGDQHNASTATMIGSSSSAVIQMSSGGYVIAKYDPTSEVIDLDLYGGATTNGMTLTVETGIPLVGNVSVNSADYIFPLSYHYNITLNRTESQSSASYTMGQSFQMLPGSRLTVNEGVHLTVGSMIVLDASYTDASDTRKYPKTNEITGETLADACLTVYGTLSATALGGNINTDSVSKITSITTKSYSTTDIKTAATGGLSGEMGSAVTKIAMIVCDGKTYTWLFGQTDVSDVTGKTLCTVTFNANGSGAATQSGYVIQGEPFTLPAALASYSTTSLLGKKTTYTFTYWNDGSTNYSAGASYKPSGDTTFNANWNGVEEDSGGCVTGDTLVTLADGTRKELQYVTYEDQLLVWNFYTGEYTAISAGYLINHGYAENTVIRLTFEDGTEIKVVNVHGFFDSNINEFVFITAENVADYLGHTFQKQSGDGFVGVKLVDYSVTIEYIEAYSILSSQYYNCLLEGMLTITPPEVGGNIFMPFEVGEEMVIDAEQMQKDIEAYGLYTYEEWSDRMSRELFDALNMQYIKVAVGKGIITEQEVDLLLSMHFGV